MENASTPGRKAWLYEHFPVLPIPGITDVRTERCKYIAYQNDLRPRELLDLCTESMEKTNFMETAAGAQQAQKLKQELERLKKETEYRLYTRG